MLGEAVGVRRGWGGAAEPAGAAAADAADAAADGATPAADVAAAAYFVMIINTPLKFM